MAPAARGRFANSALWVALEMLGGSVFSSLGLIVIAGLIGPADLGLAAIALALAQIMNFLPETLFHDAIVQRRRLTALDIGSAFWSAMMLAIGLSGGAALAAGWIARWYGQPGLSSLLLALAVLPIASAVVSIQTARLRRAMRFRLLTLRATVSRALATAAGLVLALMGCGAWAVVAQYGIGIGALALLHAPGLNWRRLRRFSLSRARQIGHFGLKCSSLYFLDGMRGRLYFMLLGQYLPLGVLGQVNLAWRIADSLTAVTTVGIVRLYLPLFARAQGNARRLRAYLHESSFLATALLAPLFVGLALSSADLVGWLGAAKWQGMGDLLPWLCAGAIVAIIRTPSWTAILAVGQPLLTASVLAGILVATLGAVVIVSPETGMQAVICWTAPLLLSLPASLAVAGRPIGATLREQVAALLPAVMCAGTIAAAMIGARVIAEPKAGGERLVYELAAGAVAYLLSLWWVRRVVRERRGAMGVGAVPAVPAG
jgi:PST family polysaccharide transporter